MTKLTILRGISGSSKSTWAAKYLEDNPNTVVVSRDSLRMALFDKWFGVDEDFITKIEHQAIRQAFSAGKDVVSDNTNISQSSVNKLIAIAREFDADIEVKQFDVDFETAWLRVEERRRDTGKEIPYNVLKRQFANLKKTPTLKINEVPTFETYVAPDDKPGALVVDIDGTLANHKVGDSHRGPFDWSRVGEDHLIEPVRNMVNTYYESGYIVILLSGREAVCRDETVRWLDKHGVRHDRLFMRAEKDHRPDTIIKMELFDQHIRDNYNVIGIVDDRLSVVRQWVKHGLFVFNVNQELEEF